MNWLDVLDRPIAFHPCFVTLTGSVNAALYLSQAIYWSKRTRDADGWFYKTEREWQSEICLTRREQQGARKALNQFAFWEERRKGSPAKMYFRVNHELLGDAVTALTQPPSAQNVQQDAPTGATETTSNVQQDAPTGATPRARPISDTETTPETTNMAQALRAAQLSDTRRLMSFLARQIGKISNAGIQAKSIKWLLENGYTVEQCEACYEALAVAQKSWRTTALTWQAVQKEIGAWLKKQEANPQSKPTAVFTRPRNWRELGLKVGDPNYKWLPEDQV